MRDTWWLCHLRQNCCCVRFGGVGDDCCADKWFIFSLFARCLLDYARSLVRGCQSFLRLLWNFNEIFESRSHGWKSALICNGIRNENRNQNELRTLVRPVHDWNEMWSSQFIRPKIQRLFLFWNKVKFLLRISFVFPSNPIGRNTRRYIVIVCSFVSISLVCPLFRNSQTVMCPEILVNQKNALFFFLLLWQSQEFEHSRAHLKYKTATNKQTYLVSVNADTRSSKWSPAERWSRGDTGQDWFDKEQK